MKLKHIFITLGVVSLLSLFSCGNGANIKIGVMLPLTGDAASYGLGAQKGIDLAFEEAGLENVELIVEDSGCEGKNARSAAEKLVSVDGVVATIGELCSSATIAAAPTFESGEVVLISPASTSPKISESGDFIFRSIPSDALQGVFAAGVVYNAGLRNLAVLYPNEDYGVGFSEVLEGEFKSIGGNVVASESFERGTTDVRAQLTKIRSAKPDVLFVISNSPDAAVAALRQIKELGLKVKLYGSEGLKSDEIAAAPGAEGLIISSVSVGNDDFIQRHRDRYGEAPGPFAAQGYDAFLSLAAAIKSGASTGAEIRDYLYMLNLEGVSGVIDFDENGDISGNYDLYRSEGGSFVPFFQ